MTPRGEGMPALHPGEFSRDFQMEKSRNPFHIRRRGYQNHGVDCPGIVRFPNGIRSWPRSGRKKQF
ncbi:hypothetical protein ASZ90_014707 [hydrocarbon metagenome]|uniref:Uncharacterized protein n=1 Tax=hydrocarbon metagenome TaxID=938273 RepID=A0A0W8F4G2_9ZZZZ